MKKFLITLIIFNLFFTNFAFATNKYFTYDKKLHMGASFLIATSTDMIYSSIYEYNHNNKLPSKLKRFTISFFTGITIGILKELYDENKYNGHFSHNDLKADFLGALAGSLFTIQIKW